MAVKPSLATNSTLAAIYASADKSWAGDLALLAPAQLRSVEPINRSLHCISDWIDAVTQEDSLVDSDAVKAHNLAAQAAVTAITNVTDGDTLSKIVKLLEYRADNRILLAFPVGAVYISTVDTNPGTFIGGTWEAFATGRTLVGKAATGTFATAGATMGHEALAAHSHSTTVDYTTGAGTTHAGTGIPPHNNVQDAHKWSGASDTAGTGDSGNIQPSIVVYMWKRTA
jgi:hypothetical protein